jgi:hypothetical protein
LQKCIARSLASARARRRLRRPRRRRQSRSGDRCSTTMSSASNADIAAGCSAGIFASLMGLNPRNIASAGGCHLITRSLHRPIRSGVRQWQSRSVLVANRRKPSCRLPKWSQRAHSGVAANRDRQPRSSSHAAARRSRESASGSGLYPARLRRPDADRPRAEARFSASKSCQLSSLAHRYRARLGQPLR